MYKLLTAVGTAVPLSGSHISDKLHREFVRKAIHLLVAFVPYLAWVNRPLTMAALASGTLFYVFSEALRLRGSPVLLVSDITVLASRDGDRGRFVLGPVTLGLGAMLALLLYPEPAATIAIYALAFGDGFASIVGMSFGRRRVPFTRDKTIAGSLACFLGVYLSCLLVTGDHGFALPIALASTVLEAIPTGDLDNLLIPVGTGLVANILTILT